MSAPASVPPETAPPEAAWAGAHRTTIQMRYSDTDMMGHVNNAAYAQFLETARMACMDAMLPAPLRRDGPRGGELTLVLARLAINYRREVRLGQAVEALLLVARVGGSSWTYAFRILADGEVCAEGETVQVHLGEDRRPAALPAEFRVVLLARQESTLNAGGER